MRSKYDVNKLKEYELKILDEFVSICENNNLNYYLAYGTLLGAIRHKGFIPWDDDIDVYMKGQDYYKLKKIMLKNNESKYFCQSLESEKYYNLSFAKIRMKNTLALEEKTKDEPFNKGIFIDIFPLIPYPTNKKDQKKFRRKIKLYNLLVESDMKNKTKYNNYGNVGKTLSKIFKIIPRSFRNIVAKRTLKKIILYNKEFDNYICIFDNIIFDKQIFANSIKVEYENKKYYSPKEYDKYLTTIYGDYMTPPKEEDRKGHSFIEVKFENEDDIIETKN